MNLGIQFKIIVLQLLILIASHKMKETDYHLFNKTNELINNLKAEL